MRSVGRTGPVKEVYFCFKIVPVFVRSVRLTASFLASLEANVGISLPGATEALGRNR